MEREGAQREPRQVAQPLPLRARRAHRDRARDHDRARDRQAARPDPREEPLRHRRRRRQHLRRRGRRPAIPRAARCTSSSPRTTRCPSTRASSRCRSARAAWPATSRSSRRRSTSPTSTTCRRARRSASIARSTRRSATARRACSCTPLISSKGEVIGVIQLINKKREPKQKLLSPEDVERSVVPFDERSEELVDDARRAGRHRARERDPLRRDPQASSRASCRRRVEAIEPRDPTTSGHSRRVADLTVGLAQAVERADTGPYRDVALHARGHPRDRVRVAAPRLRQDRRARAGARQGEEALPARARAHPPALRLRDPHRSRPTSSRASSRALERGAPTSELAALDQRARRSAAPSSRTRGASIEQRERADGARRRRLQAHRGARPRRRTLDLDGQVDTLLSATRGAVAQRDARLAHARGVRRDPQPRRRTPTSSSRRSPGARRSRASPLIAGAHHERLNGTGYPNRLRAEEIPLQSKMMTISDIFDALTASDRPYKRAVPVEKALDILGSR